MQQVRSSSGFVPFSAALAPFRAVGEHKGQLARLHSSHSISPLAPPAFTGFIATMRRSDFFSGMASLSLPPSTLPLSWTRSPWVRMNGFPPLPSSIPSCHDWISGVALTSTFAQTRRPYKASLSLGAAVSLRLPSHTPSRERSVQALAGSGLAAPRSARSPVALRAPSDPADVILSINVLIYDPPPPSTLISRSGLSQGCWHRGRPGESHPQPLAERYVNLSTHTAPIRRTHLVLSSSASPPG